MAEVEPFRQVCPGCHRSLKIRVDEIPDDDFTIQCPKCKTEVAVRVAAIRAAMSRPSGAERSVSGEVYRATPSRSGSAPPAPAIEARNKDGAGGEGADLSRKGRELFRGDSSDDHKQAADYFRRAVVAAPPHPEPMAALALNSLFLPKSDREGIGVTQAAVWADYV